MLVENWMRGERVGLFRREIGNGGNLFKFKAA
jgi:hypothetical protein